MTRFACMLRWGSGALALVLAPLAHAGDTSSSSDSGSSDSGSTDSGTSDSGTDSGSSDSGTDSGSTTAACGMCEMVPGDAVITTPNDGANVNAPFTLEVTVVPRIGCECTEVLPMNVRLYLDEEPYGEPCTELACSWEIDTSIGAHDLYAMGTFGPDDYVGTTVMIYVQSVATDTGADTGVGTSETGPSAEETSTGTGAATEPKGGCSCDATDRRGGVAVWLAAFGLLVRRRRTAR